MPIKKKTRISRSNSTPLHHRFNVHDYKNTNKIPHINEILTYHIDKFDKQNNVTGGKARQSPMLGMGRLQKLKFEQRGKGAVVKKKDGLGPREPREVTISQAKRFQVLFTGVIDPDPARQQATTNLLNKFFEAAPKSQKRPVTVGPRIRYSQPDYFLLPDEEPLTKPVIFHKNRRFEDESKKFKDPGQEKLSSTLDVDSRAWNHMSAYIQSPTKSIRRKPLKLDNPPHCYITSKHKVKPFVDTSLLAYHTQFQSKRDRFQKEFSTKGDAPGPGTYPYPRDSCKIKDPKRNTSSFVQLSYKPTKKPIKKGYTRPIDHNETMKTIIARRRHMELPFPKRRFTPKPKKQNKNLGPGEYENTLNGWEFCRGKERSHKFNSGGMSRYGSSGGITVDTILNNFDPNEPRKHKWPRDEFDIDPAIVKSTDFWKIERQQNGGKADSDDDTDEEDDWEYE